MRFHAPTQIGFGLLSLPGAGILRCALATLGSHVVGFEADAREVISKLIGTTFLLSAD